MKRQARDTIIARLEHRGVIHPVLRQLFVDTEPSKKWRFFQPGLLVVMPGPSPLSNRDHTCRSSPIRVMPPETASMSTLWGWPRSQPAPMDSSSRSTLPQMRHGATALKAWD